MGWVDHLSEEELKNAVLENVTKLYILTGEQARPDEPYVTWFYQICCEHPLGYDFLTISKSEGFAEFCKCDECADFGLSLYEYYSVCQALMWIRERYPLVSLELWVGSERFYSDWKYLASYQGLYRCAFLRTLGRDQERHLSTFDVVVRTDWEYEREDDSYGS